MTSDEKLSKTELLTMAQGLEIIKNTDDFKLYGFGVGGPHNGWILNINRLLSESAKMQDDLQVIASDLHQIAMSYVFQPDKRRAYDMLLSELIDNLKEVL